MKKRPTGITILAIYVLLFALGHIAVSVVCLAAIMSGGLDPIVLSLAIIFLFPAVVSIIVGWGLWTLRSWSRKLCIFWAVWGLLYFPIGTILSAFIIWYLFQPYVVAAFEGWLPPGYGVGAPGVQRNLSHEASSASGGKSPGVDPGRNPGSQSHISDPALYRQGAPSKQVVNAWLIDRHTGHSFQLYQDDTRMGRGPNNDIKLEDRSVSREHALIREQGGHYTLYDRASRTGTLVNEQRISGPRTLVHGDVIWLGDIQLQFVSS